MGYIMECDGAKVDPKNIQAMRDWPRPKILNNLSDLLGLTGYYQKFVRNYGKNVSPLTSLLKKKAFTWTEVVDQYFLTL